MCIVHLHKVITTSIFPELGWQGVFLSPKSTESFSFENAAISSYIKTIHLEGSQADAYPKRGVSQGHHGLTP
jgi:hypothetical protein